MADASDIASLLMDANPQANAKALAAALRQQQQLGNAMTFVANPEKGGEQITGGAMEMAKQIPEMAEKRLGLSMQALGQQRQLAALQSEIEQRQFEREKANREFGASEYHKGVAEKREQKGQEIEAGKASRLPSEAIERLGYMKSGLDAVDNAEQQFMNDPRAYVAQHEAHGTALGHALFEKGREGAAREAAGMLPGKALLGAAVAGPLSDQAKKQAHLKFEGIREKIRGQQQAFISGYRQSGFNVPDAEPTEAPMPKGAVKMLRHKATGQIKYLDASGKEVK